MKLPQYGDHVSYETVEDGHIKGRVVGVDSYKSHAIVTIKREDGSLYGAKLPKVKRDGK